MKKLLNAKQNNLNGEQEIFELQKTVTLALLTKLKMIRMFLISKRSEVEQKRLNQIVAELNLEQDVEQAEQEKNKIMQINQDFRKLQDIIRQIDESFIASQDCQFKIDPKLEQQFSLSNQPQQEMETEQLGQQLLEDHEKIIVDLKKQNQDQLMIKEQQITELKNQIEVLKKEIEIKANQEVEARNQSTQLEKQVEEFRVKFTQMETSSNIKNNSLEQINQSLKEQVITLEQKSNNQQYEINTQLKQLKKFDKRVQLDTTKHQELQNKYNQLTNQYEEAIQQYINLRSKIIGIFKQIQEKTPASCTEEEAIDQFVRLYLLKIEQIKDIQSMKEQISKAKENSQKDHIQKYNFLEQQYNFQRNQQRQREYVNPLMSSIQQSTQSKQIQSKPPYSVSQNRMLNQQETPIKRRLICRILEQGDITE